MAGLLLVAGGGSALLGFLLQALDVASLPASAETAPLQALPAGGLLLYGCLHALAALPVAWASIGLLRLRPWARGAVEALSWLGLAYVALASVWLARDWDAIARGLQALSPAPLQLPSMGAGAAAVNIALHGAPLALAIYFLRKPEIRAAFER
ncbi:MAG: hypothetical protein AB7O37_07835 [Vicinamibacteria bacterium]